MTARSRNPRPSGRGGSQNVQPGSIHQEPAWSRGRGLIVPSWEDTRTVPVRTVDGPVWLTCGGTATFTPPDAPEVES